jgi:hypothetical protein
MQTAWLADSAQTGLHGFTGMMATEASVSFRLTAQAMGNGYSDGISTATLPELCDRVNGTGLVVVTPDDLRAGVVRRADPFADVLTSDLSGVAEALRLVGRTSGPATRTVGRGKTTTLYQTLPDKAGHLKAYWKTGQLQLAAHRSFCDAYPGAVAQLGGHHRFEITARSYKASRSLASMTEGRPTLADVLDSARSPVADALDALLSTWGGARRAVLSLPNVPRTLNEMLSRPRASARVDSMALLASLLASYTEGDYTATCEAYRTLYDPKGKGNAARFYPTLRAACEAYGRPDADGAHSEALGLLRVVADRVRDREGSENHTTS